MFGSNNVPPPSIPPDPAKLALRPEESQTLTLKDGRILGYATYGSTNPSDPVIFLFHGMPGSRIVGRGFDTASKTVAARLITIDRPGCGLSTIANRRLIDWPADVLALADHLSIHEFSIIGASAGGPFALACARFIPASRLRHTTVVCGIGPIEALLDTIPLLSWRLCGLTLWLLKNAARWIVLPSLIRPYLVQGDAARMKALLISQCSTPAEIAQIKSTPPDADAHVDNAVAQMLEAVRQGPAGAYQDGAILTADWGFKLENVEAGRVRLVHGDRDAVAPVEVARWIDRKLGEGRLEVVEGGTHFTIWEKGMEEILRGAVDRDG